MVGPMSSTVWERGLVVRRPTMQQVIGENEAYFRNTHNTSFDGVVLGFVTPWNHHGYDVAKIFRGKFSFISPYWLQIEIYADKGYQITGLHNDDMNWIREVKRRPSAKHKVKVVPKLRFEHWERIHIAELLSYASKWEEFIHQLTDTAQVHKYDGYVLELWEDLSEENNEILDVFVSYLCESLHKFNLLCMLIVPIAISNQKEKFNMENFDALEKDVDAFLISSYEFSASDKPGPNSPIQWVRGFIEKLVPNSRVNDLSADLVAFSQKRSKILMGLNFYGRDYTVNGGRNINGPDFVKLLSSAISQRRIPKVIYDSESEETSFEIRTKSSKHIIYFPTLWSIQKRIELARKMGTGLVISELGVGMDYFYDLL
ncbi:hypothetical protein J437_LFUL016370 [Ladona fulva]|uniref:Chitinase domain-containing protein 1 n=1 Tax=Ladona fulva TaxID=123851 RepID=A0A8K0KJI3_LADFU|nr:hypothetical protein J437_LFUL016370 [Ladona fulva]